MAMPLWIKDKLFQKSQLIKDLINVLGEETNWHDRILFSEHHLSLLQPVPFIHRPLKKQLF